VAFVTTAIAQRLPMKIKTFFVCVIFTWSCFVIALRRACKDSTLMQEKVIGCGKQKPAE
jgi:hypothetical protein